MKAVNSKQQPVAKQQNSSSSSSSSSAKTVEPFVVVEKDVGRDAYDAKAGKALQSLVLKHFSGKKAGSGKFRLMFTHVLEVDYNVTTGATGTVAPFIFANLVANLSGYSSIAPFFDFARVTRFNFEYQPRGYGRELTQTAVLVTAPTGTTSVAVTGPQGDMMLADLDLETLGQPSSFALLSLKVPKKWGNTLGTYVGNTNLPLKGGWSFAKPTKAVLTNTDSKQEYTSPANWFGTAESALSGAFAFYVPDLYPVTTSGYSSQKLGTALIGVELEFAVRSEV